MDRRQIVAGLAGFAMACGRGVRTVAGSKNFTEQVLLGEIVAQHLERRLRRPVDRKLDLGGTLLAHQALTAGQIDVYPEYTGTALTAILKLPPSSDPDTVFERVRSEYQARFGLLWLPPLGFNNSFAMVIPGNLARSGNLKTLSQAARAPQPWKLGVGYEFLRRPDGLPALTSAYGLRVEGAPKTMDLGLLYRALEQGQVNMVAANTTDGLLSVMDVTVLADDRHAFPPYQAALVARPSLKEALEPLSGRLSETKMRALNYAIDGRHRPAREVAAEFLNSTGSVRGARAAVSPWRD